jgi:hypothetical protein
MGNSNSSLNDKVNEILNEATPVAPAPGAAGVPILTEAPKNAFVTGTTESPTSSAPAPSGPISTSPTSAEQSATSAAPVPLGINVLSATSAAPVVATSSPSKKSKIHVAAFGFNYKGPADDLNSAVEAALRASPKPSKDLNKAVQDAMLSDAAPQTQKGGYTYAGEVNSEPQAGGNSTGQIYLDPSLFLSESEQVGGTNEFNPEKFFNDMQKGGQDYLSPGSVVHRGKKVKKTGLDKTFDTSPDTDDDDGFDLDEEGLEQDTDEEEDTEDVKNKVKHLRAMVARSKGKKVVKGKRRHNKRMTETGGASENSVSEYLDTTSSINTSDVKLISMKRK